MTSLGRTARTVILASSLGALAFTAPSCGRVGNIGDRPHGGGPADPYSGSAWSATPATPQAKRDAMMKQAAH